MNQNICLTSPLIQQQFTVQSVQEAYGHSTYVYAECVVLIQFEFKTAEQNENEFNIINC